MVARPPLPASMVTAIVLLWVNVGIGALLLLTASSGAVLIVAWMAGYAAVAIGLQRRALLARSAGLVLSGTAYVMGLTRGMFVSTTTVVFIALLWPAAVKAARDWASSSSSSHRDVG